MRRASSHTAVPILLLVLLLVAPSLEAETTSQCAPMLLPQVHWESLDTYRHVAYLKLVDKSTFESSRAGGGIKGILQDLGLPFDASYEQFAEARSRYIERTRLQITEEQSIAVFRQTLTADQLKLYVECIQTSASGIRLLLADDTKDGVNVKITFSGLPGHKEKFKLSVVGGLFSSGDSITVTLPHGGAQEQFVKRSAPKGDIRVLANGGGLSASAFSFGELPSLSCPTPPPCPKVQVVRIAPVDISASRNPTGLAATIDGDPVTGWNSGAGPEQWIEFKLPRPMTVTSIEVTPLSNCNCPAHYKVLGFSAAGTESTLAVFDAFLRLEYLGPGGLFGNPGGTSVNYRVGVTLDATHSDTVRVRLVGVAMNSWVAFREVTLFGY